MDKLKLLQALDALPDDLAEKCYRIELIERKAFMQYNRWLKDKYKFVEFADIDLDMELKIGGWRVFMEAEGDQWGES